MLVLAPIFTGLEQAELIGTEHPAPQLIVIFLKAGFINVESFLAGQGLECLQRSCRDEFYSRYKGQTLAEVREELSDYEQLYNTFCPPAALDYLTPFEY